MWHPCVVRRGHDRPALADFGVRAGLEGGGEGEDARNAAHGGGQGIAVVEGARDDLDPAGLQAARRRRGGVANECPDGGLVGEQRIDDSTTLAARCPEYQHGWVSVRHRVSPWVMKRRMSGSSCGSMV